MRKTRGSSIVPVINLCDTSEGYPLPIPVIISDGRHNRPRERGSRTLSNVSRSTHNLLKPARQSDPGSFIPPSIYVINATSIAKPHAINHLHADLIAYDIGIAVITESWLKSHHTDGQFALPGYKLFRRDRLKRRGGGLAMYVKNGLDASIVDLNKPIDRNIELMWVQVSLSGRVFVIGAVYHLPKPIYQESELFLGVMHILYNASGVGG